MRLYLIRHGDASPAARDSERTLSPKGRNEIRGIAKFLKKEDVRVPEIFHSGLRRAEETAEIIAQTLACRSQLVKKESLAPNDPVDPMIKELAGHSKDLAIAGHMPYLSNLYSRLLTGAPNHDIIEFKKGAVVCLERDENQPWRLRWFVTPKIV